MKRLYLLRHAKAEPYSFYKDDYERDLTQKGREQAISMGRLFFKEKFEVEKIYFSSANRTQQTTEHFSEAALINLENAVAEKSLYNCELEAYNKLLHALPDELKSVMLVGHNNTISAAVEFYANKVGFSMPLAGLAVIDFKINSWTELNRNGELVNFNSPE